MKIARVLGIALLALPFGVLAQAAPAAKPATAKAPAPAGNEQPAVRTTVPEDLRDQAGTTIVGERESPIGLYITPWRDAYAEQDIDRPARLLQVDMAPLDRTVFARQVEYYDALTEAAKAKSAPATAANPAAAAP